MNLGGKITKRYIIIFKMAFIILISSCFALVKTEDPQWVDPYDMTIPGLNLIKSKDEHLGNKEVIPMQLVFTHYKQLISLFLNTVEFDENSSIYKGQLSLNIPIADYKFLKHFIREATEEHSSLRRIDEIMNRIFARSKLEAFSKVFVSWTEYIYFTFYNRVTLIILFCLFLLFISYKLLKSNFTLWSVVKYLLFIGWVVDFAFCWINQLQELEINKLADGLKYKNIPIHCNPAEMSFFQYIWYVMSTTDKCQEYHQMLYKDVFWSIAPLKIFSYQFGVLVYTPAAHIGQGISLFTSGLLSSLPWGLNIILLPLLLIFSIILLTIFCGILLSFLTETSIEFNFLHLLKLNFGNRERNAVGDLLTRSNLRRLLDITHRNMVEDVSPKDMKNSEIENCTCSDSPKEKKILKIVEDSDSNIPEKVSENIIEEVHDESGDK